MATTTVIPTVGSPTRRAALRLRERLQQFADFMDRRASAPVATPPATVNKQLWRAALCGAITAAGVASPAARAEPALGGQRQALRLEQGAAAARSGVAVGAQGQVHATSQGGFTSAGGAHGRRSASLQRGADGSLDAQRSASATGPRGNSAEASGSATRAAGGSSASAERNAHLSNAGTGNSLDASLQFAKGSGLSRSVSCQDAAGNTVSCGSR